MENFTPESAHFPSETAGESLSVIFACIWVRDRWGGWQARRRAQLQCLSLRGGGWGRLGIREDGDSEREGFPVTTFFD